VVHVSSLCYKKQIPRCARDDTRDKFSTNQRWRPEGGRYEAKGNVNCKITGAQQKLAATKSTPGLTALKFWGAQDQTYYQAFVNLLYGIIEARLQNLRIF
jgi:hypothetical protein